MVPGVQPVAWADEWLSLGTVKVARMGWVGASKLATAANMIAIAGNRQSDWHRPGFTSSILGIASCTIISEGRGGLCKTLLFASERTTVRNI